MNDDADDETIVLLYLLAEEKRLWVHNILQARKQCDEYYRLVQELEWDEDGLKLYFLD